jgi:hypothetical protein
VIGDRSTAADLRGRPAVLIGQFNNVDDGLTGNLRYYIDRSTELRYEYWTGRTLARRSSRRRGMPAGRGVCDRQPHLRRRRKTVVSIAGMTFNGTIAAGEFLTNERYMHEAF